MIKWDNTCVQLTGYLAQRNGSINVRPPGLMFNVFNIYLVESKKLIFRVHLYIYNRMLYCCIKHSITFWCIRIWKYMYSHSLEVMSFTLTNNYLLDIVTKSCWKYFKLFFLCFSLENILYFRIRLLFWLEACLTYNYVK